MPRKSHRIQRFLCRLFLLSLAGWALSALRGESRRGHDDDEVEFLPASGFTTPTVTGPVRLERWEDGRPSPVRKRAALAMVFTALFFSGAALTAGAGDQASKLFEETDSTTTLAEETSEPATEEPAAEPGPAPEQSEPVATEPAPEAAPATEAAPEASPEPAPASGGDVSADPAAAAEEEAQPVRSASARAARAAARRAPTAAAAPTARPQGKPKPVRPQATAEEEAAVHGGAAIIWLNRALPDPTPPARRLSPTFAKQLIRASRQAEANWGLVLGVLRAQGHRGRTPATMRTVRRLAGELHAYGSGRDEWGAALAVTGSTEKADKAVALARYNRAVGINALMRGLAAEKKNLVRRVLKNRRIEIYAGGRDDLSFGRIDVRVVALMAYLAESYGQVSVSSLFSGHRLYARPGVVSAHVYGHAVDIAALGGMPITGHQQPGGITEQAVRSILLLPSELQPRQVISLLGLGGASFPLADHHDHIHVGY